MSGSVATLERIELGGVEQSVLIRGRDRSKPVLLFLHGGPGNPATYLAHAFQRLLDDTHELAGHLADRFGNDRIYLLGHSWGSYLGLLAVRERPERYLGYVGTGQLAASRERMDAVRREGLAARALAAGDSSAALAFRDGSRAADEAALFAYGAELRGASSFWPILWMGLRAPEYTLLDGLAVRKGIQRSGTHMRLDELEAPLKRLVWFDSSAHFPFLSEPARFHRTLLDFHRDVTTH